MRRRPGMGSEAGRVQESPKGRLRQPPAERRDRVEHDEERDFSKDNEEKEANLSTCKKCRFLRALRFFADDCLPTNAALSRLLAYFQNEAAAKRDSELPLGLRLLFRDALEMFSEEPLCLLAPAALDNPFFSHPCAKAPRAASAETADEPRRDSDERCPDRDHGDTKEKERDNGDRDAAEARRAEDLVQSQVEKNSRQRQAALQLGEGDSVVLSRGVGGRSSAAPSSAAPSSAAPSSAVPSSAAASASETVADCSSSVAFRASSSSLSSSSSASPSSASLSVSSAASSQRSSASSASACNSMCRRVRLEWLAETKERVDALHAASWRSLHAGKWSDVPQAFRAIYAFSACMLAVLFAANAAADLEWGVEAKAIARQDSQDTLGDEGDQALQNEGRSRCRRGEMSGEVPEDTQELSGEEDSDEGRRDLGGHGRRENGNGEKYSRLAFRYADLGLIMGGPETPIYDILQSFLNKCEGARISDTCPSSSFASASSSSSSPPSSSPSSSFSASPAASLSGAPPRSFGVSSSCAKRSRRQVERNEESGHEEQKVKEVVLPCTRWGMRRVPSVEATQLSLSEFLSRVFVPQRPLLIRGGASHWPAISKWSNWTFLKEKLGDRLLPVEVGQAYTADDWGQTLMRGETLLASILESACRGKRRRKEDKPTGDSDKQGDSKVKQDEIEDSATDTEDNEIEDSGRDDGEMETSGREEAEVEEDEMKEDELNAEKIETELSTEKQGASPSASTGRGRERTRHETECIREGSRDAAETGLSQKTTIRRRKRLKTLHTNMTLERPTRKPILYMAQHALLEQVPALAADCPTPDLALCAAQSDTLIRLAWIGPKGTVSPAHTDEWQNFFVQVVGCKRFQLYPPEASASLYPFPKGPLTNTSGAPLELFLEENEDQKDEQESAGMPGEKAERNRKHGEETRAEEDALGPPARRPHHRLVLPSPRAVSSLPEVQSAEEAEEVEKRSQGRDKQEKEGLRQKRDEKEREEATRAPTGGDGCASPPEGRRKSDREALREEGTSREGRERGEYAKESLRASFPLFDRRRGFEVLVKPGDILFIPKLWWHLVFAETASVSLSHWVN
ncbi:histone lysine demethylase JMJD5 [Toxoplasma gondii MAS]|uniref:Histone lysine demethylase JMJD5 n=1 Tax=Toxoplasma gondii MAS TaxID=943118 RepID=A0A086PN90_TOXGO|nr:histone lysine demethylase JMJD5 [Toxoplasma gondii MAS]